MIALSSIYVKRFCLFIHVTLKKKFLTVCLFLQHFYFKTLKMAYTYYKTDYYAIQLINGIGLLIYSTAALE